MLFLTYPLTHLVSGHYKNIEDRVVMEACLGKAEALEGARDYADFWRCPMGIFAYRTKGENILGRGRWIASVLPIGTGKVD